AARFYGEAFAAGQQLADKVAWPDHYDAACAAALAGCGRGADTESLDNQERARLRQQALNWLRAELKAILEKSLDKADSGVGKQLEQWLKDAAFADVRGAESLARLPAAERSAWRQFWDEVEALTRRAGAGPAAAKPARP